MTDQQQSNTLPIIALVVSLLALAAAVTMLVLQYSAEPATNTTSNTTTTTNEVQTNQVVNDATSSTPSTISNLVESNNTTSDAAQITFDGCGTMQKYADDTATYPWFADADAAYKAETGFPLYSAFGGPAASEGCYSANGDMFIFIKENGYSEASTIYKYEINNDRLSMATLDGEDAQQFHASSKGFGEREGNVIHLEPALTGDAGSCAEFSYDYNFVTNVQSYLSQKSVACN